MHTISVEIYSENVTIDIINKPGLTQPWNIVHHNNVIRNINNLTFRAVEEVSRSIYTNVYI